MANIQERRNKKGKLISFSIRVHRGRGADGKQLKPYTATFDVNPSWKEETARKKANAFAAVFEKECKEGVRADSRQTFEEYCEYVIDMKEHRGAKRSTISLYNTLAERIYTQIGHIKLKDLRVEHLNELYTYLSSDGLNKNTGGKLSNETIIKHHRLISTVLEQAVKEGLIPFNPAERADPPKVTRKDPNYFEEQELNAIFEALKKEPFKWQVLIYMLLATGARRGEILGLKWDKVDFENAEIHICNNLLYTPDAGIYEETPKTKKSDRYIPLPYEAIQLLHKYKLWQTEERLKLGLRYKNQNFVFTQENGNPMHPSSVTNYLSKFSKRYNLPHINPHAFRHTNISIKIFEGQDIATICEESGHNQVSTTLNIYTSVYDKKNRKSADAISKHLPKFA